MLDAMRWGALPMSNVPGALSAFRLSRGCKLELILAKTPTSVNVAEDSASACRSWEWLATSGVSFPALSATASESVVGSKCVRPAVGYASDAKRKGSGMRNAVRASGSSSHDLWDG